MDVRCDLISALILIYEDFVCYSVKINIGQLLFTCDDLSLFLFSKVKRNCVPVLKLTREIIKYEPAWILAPLFFSDILSIFSHYLHKVGPDFFY